MEKEHPSTYFVQDRSSIDEMHRLVLQDRLLTEKLGGIFPELSTANVKSIRSVLDIACGPGSWILEGAKAHEHIKWAGVDISATMINYAREQAQQEQLSDRVTFATMDALRMLEFPDQSFDLVNIRLGVSFLRTWDWPKLIHEMIRVCRVGGILRIGEATIGGETTSPALAQVYALTDKAMHRAGHLFEPEPDGLIKGLPKLLEQAQVQHVQQRAVAVETTHSQPELLSLFKEDTRILSKLLGPFLQKWAGPSFQNYNDLCEQALRDIDQDDFRTKGAFVTFWGFVPGGSPLLPVSTQKTKPFLAAAAKVALTKREREIAEMCGDHTDQQIADALNISQSTVHTHINSVFKKLNITRRQDIAQILHALD